MKPLYSILLAALIAISSLSFTSCSNSRSTMRELEQMNSRLENDSTSYSKSEFEAEAARFAKLCEDIENHSDEYSDEEKEQARYLIGQCLANLTKLGMNEFGENVNQWLQDSEGVIKGFLSNFSKDDINSFLDDLDSSLKEIGDSLDELDLDEEETDIDSN